MSMYISPIYTHTHTKVPKCRIIQQFNKVLHVRLAMFDIVKYIGTS